MKNLLISILIFSAHIVQGQAGRLKGNVYISGTKIQIDSVLVKMVGMDTTLVFKTESNSEGLYEFRDIPPSLYEIEFSRKGFDTIRITGVVVLAMKITMMDASLERISTKKVRKRKKGTRMRN